MAALAIAAFFTGCAKDGADGPAGPAGPQGNANVRVEMFSVAPGEWSSSGSIIWVEKSVSVITNEIADNGAVLVYVKALGNTWMNVENDGAYLRYGVGHVQMTYENATVPTSTEQYKIVAIASSGMIVDSGVDVHDYEAVRAHFGLE
jgi:hypothetical protein